MNNKDAAERAAEIVREWVEHDLDEHYGDDVEFIIRLPPLGLVERIADGIARFCGDSAGGEAK